LEVIDQFRSSASGTMLSHLHAEHWLCKSSNINWRWATA